MSTQWGHNLSRDADGLFGRYCHRQPRMTSALRMQDDLCYVSTWRYHHHGSYVAHPVRQLHRAAATNILWRVWLDCIMTHKDSCVWRRLFCRRSMLGSEMRSSDKSSFGMSVKLETALRKSIQMSCSFSVCTMPQPEKPLPLIDAMSFML